MDTPITPSELLALATRIADDLRPHGHTYRQAALVRIKEKNEVLWALVWSRLYP